MKENITWWRGPALYGEWIHLVDFHHFYRGDNFYDFLCSFLDTESLQKRDLFLIENNCVSGSRMGQIGYGGKSILERVASPTSVPVSYDYWIIVLKICKILTETTSQVLPHSDSMNFFCWVLKRNAPCSTHCIDSAQQNVKHYLKGNIYINSS